jgi:hypothetical protein
MPGATIDGPHREERINLPDPKPAQTSRSVGAGAYEVRGQLKKPKRLSKRFESRGRNAVRVALDYVLYGTVAGHEPGGVTGQED